MMYMRGCEVHIMTLSAVVNVGGCELSERTLVSSKDASEIPPCLSVGLALHFSVSKVPLSLTATPFSCYSFSSI